MYQYFEELWELFVSMSFYMVIGLLCTGFLHAFVKQGWIKKQLGSKSASSVVKAAVVGVPLPLCSCGVVPMAVYLRQSGASKGATISFLTSTPQTGVDSIIATYGLMGPLFAIFRPFAAFISGITTGFVTNYLSQEQKTCCCSGHKKEKEEEAKPQQSSCCCSGHKKEEEAKPQASSCCCSKNITKEEEAPKLSFLGKMISMFTFAFGEFLDRIAKNFVIGLLVAALLATVIPEDFFNVIQHPLLSMLIVLLVGIPMYVCSTASIPIAVSLMMKGLSPGAAFVFLFTGPATNVASLAVLMKVFDKKTMLIYISTLCVCAISFGLLLDYIGGDAVLSQVESLHCNEHSLFMQSVAVGFGLIIAYRFARGWLKKSA